MPRSLRSAAVLTLVVASTQLVACSNLLFFPSRQLRITPAEVGMEYEDVFFESADATRLHAWWLPARRAPAPPAARALQPLAPAPTVLFVHGNAGNLASHLGGVYWLPSRGYSVFAFDYRGFGRSAGKTDLEGTYEDTRAALREVARRADVDPERLFVLGQSIGGAIAVSAVASLRDEVAVRALVIDSAPSDFRAIAREKLASFWLTWPLQWPLALTLPARPKPMEAVRRLDPGRVLYLHGGADTIVPAHHSRRLAAAGGGSTVVLVDGAEHVQALADPAVRERVLEFFASSRPPEPCTPRPPSGRTRSSRTRLP